VLINSDGRACLADFGLAAILIQTSTLTGTGGFTRGTVRWMAPELLGLVDDDEGQDGGKPTYESDVYATAMVIYEVKWLQIVSIELTNLFLDFQWSNTLSSND
jgi:serine/threonine protein kinase